MSDNTDYSFMKSGFNNVVGTDNDTKKTIQSIFLGFTEFAMRDASIYVAHSNRNMVLKEDIKLGLMSETFKFLNRENKQQTVQNWKQFLNDPEEDDENDEEDDIIVNDEDEEFSYSKCECELCQNFNGIEIFWETWDPQNDIEIILKKTIDQNF
jgi:hypothetical protein